MPETRFFGKKRDASGGASIARLLCIGYLAVCADFECSRVVCVPTLRVTHVHLHRLVALR